jgi:hypothetical protein
LFESAKRAGFRQQLAAACAPTPFQPSLLLRFTSSARQPLTEASSNLNGNLRNVVGNRDINSVNRINTSWIFNLFQPIILDRKLQIHFHQATICHLNRQTQRRFAVLTSWHFQRGSVIVVRRTTRMEQSPSIFSQLIPLIPITLAVLIAGYFMLRRIRRQQAKFQNRRRPSIPSTRLPYFVFAKIMDKVAPMERGPKYEDPLDDALRQRGIGFTTGAGTQLDKAGKVEWVGIDIELCDVDGALDFTRQCLHELGAPSGSVLEYRVGDEQKTVQIG